MICLNKDLKSIVEFQSNRYFIDSINVNALCSENELVSFSKNINRSRIMVAEDLKWKSCVMMSVCLLMFLSATPVTQNCL